MKFFLRLIFIAILTYFLSMIAPWWILAVVALAGGAIIPGKWFTVFVSGFLGVGIVWMGYAWKLDAENESMFTSTMTNILPVGDPMVLIILTGAIGGLCGGFSALSGSLLRQPKKQKSGGYYG